MSRRSSRGVALSVSLNRETLIAAALLSVSERKPCAYLAVHYQCINRVVNRVVECCVFAHKSNDACVSRSRERCRCRHKRERRASSASLGLLGGSGAVAAEAALEDAKDRQHEGEQDADATDHEHQVGCSRRAFDIWLAA